MSDLISRSALIKVLNEWADSNAMKGYDTAYDVVQDCISTVENQPTAYNVDKVVEELERERQRMEILWESESEECCRGGAESMEYAIEIVRKGGVENE